jgi:hypothetical protein
MLAGVKAITATGLYYGGLASEARNKLLFLQAAASLYNLFYTISTSPPKYLSFIL